MKKLIGIVICIIVSGSTICSANMISNDEVDTKILQKSESPINFIEYSLDDGDKIVADSGDEWVYLDEFGPQSNYKKWPYVWTNIEDNGKSANMNNQGHGYDIIAPKNLGLHGFAYAGVGCFPHDIGFTWNGPNCLGRITLKNSDISGTVRQYDLYGASVGCVSVSIIVEIYNEQQQKIFSETSKIYQIVAVRDEINFNDELDDYKVEFPIHYKASHMIFICIEAHGFSDTSHDGEGYARVKTVNLRKAVLEFKESPINVDLEKPKKGEIYLLQMKTPWRTSSFFLSILLMCSNGIECEASTVGDVEYVKFKCGDVEVIDEKPDGNLWKARLTGVYNGIKTLEVYAYDDHHNGISDSVKILKLGGG